MRTNLNTASPTRPTSGFTSVNNAQRFQQVPRTFAEYFAGIGLVRLGLEAEGWQTLYANDFSPQKHQIYESFFPQDQHYEVKDVFDVQLSQVPPTTLATCSFPCIDLSLAGNMHGINGSHSSAFWGFVDILRSQGNLSPQILLIENVPGWLTSNHGDDFRLTLKSLNQLGYSFDVFTLNAIHFTPQSRLRVFAVGIRNLLPSSEPLAIFSRPPSLAPDRLKNLVASNQDLAWVSLQIPPPPPRLVSGLKHIVERVPLRSKLWWPNSQVERHLSMMSPAHRQRINALAERNVYSFRTFFRRRRSGEQRVEVRNDDIAGCLRTAVGGSSRQFIIQTGHGRILMRPMTPREYARLQGLPDHYPLPIDERRALTGLGDAVCVPAISWIAKNVLHSVLAQLDG